jgi:uncharacterized lipoprotein NlpE involved in copper resistance
MIKQTFPIAIFVAALFLVGCDKNADDAVVKATAKSDETRQSTVDARKDADGKVFGAEENASDANKSYADPATTPPAAAGSAAASAMMEKSKATYDLAMADAEKIYKDAAQKCDALDAAGRTPCIEAASEALATVKAEAVAQRDMPRTAAESKL